MIRSATLLSLVIVPTLLPAQEVGSRVHVVIGGDTLWGLAQAFYGDPYGWPRIFEANRDRVGHPDLLPPGVELVIPGLSASDEAPTEAEPHEPAEATASGSSDRTIGGPMIVVRAATAGDPARSPVVAQPTTPPSPGSPREAPQPQQAEFSFSEDVFARAPWLIPTEEEPRAPGILAGLQDEGRAGRTPWPEDRVRIRFDGNAPPNGTRLQAFRVHRTIEGLGQVVRPTGTLTVVESLPAAVVARVDALYDRMAVDDAVRVLPPFPLSRADESEPVEGGPWLPILGFAEPRAMYTLGDYLFLGGGTADGVRAGDVFDIVWDDEGAEPGQGPGVGGVQAISVQDDHATARIFHVENPVFRSGVVVRLSRRVR